MTGRLRAERAQRKRERRRERQQQGGQEAGGGEERNQDDEAVVGASGGQDGNDRGRGAKRRREAAARSAAAAPDGKGGEYETVARRPHALAASLRLFSEGKEAVPDAQVARLMRRVAQPGRKQYGGMGLAKPSKLLLPTEGDFLEKLEDAFDERIEGFSSGKASFKGLSRKQEQKTMLWKKALDAKQASQQEVARRQEARELAEAGGGRLSGGAGGVKAARARKGSNAPSSTLAAFLAEEEAAKRARQPPRQKKKSKWRKG